MKNNIVRISEVHKKSGNLRDVVYALINNDNKKLKEAAYYCRVTVDELQKFIKGKNIQFTKAKELCDFLEIDQKEIHPGYFDIRRDMKLDVNTEDIGLLLGKDIDRDIKYETYKKPIKKNVLKFPIDIG